MYDNKDVKRLYDELEKNWKEYLEPLNVKIPKLLVGGKYTKDALVLIYLYDKMGMKVTKHELTMFLKAMGCDTNDVQQARHLAQQKGWYILSGTRRDMECKQYDLNNGDYLFKTYKEKYPSYYSIRRGTKPEGSEWEQLKKRYRLQVCNMWF